MKRIITKLGIDVFIWMLVTPVAYLLRVEGSWYSQTESVLWVTLSLVPIKLAIILYDKTFLQSWHRVGLRDLFIINRGVLASTAVFVGIAYLFRNELFIPYSVPLIEAMLLIIALGGVRLTARLWYEYKFRRHPELKNNRDRVLIAGAGDAGTMIAREMMRHPEAGMKPVGFIDDDKNKQRQRFLGLEVFAGTDRVAGVCRKHNIDVLLIAMPSESGEVIRNIVEMAQGCDLEYKIIPAIHELLSGQVTMNQIRDVDVEDLLRRDPVELNMNEIADYLNHRTILVTGAGGSIGSEIVRQIYRFEPEQVILLDHSEYNIYKLEQELAENASINNYSPVVADVRDINTLQGIFERYRPDVVFHAAAHKHVPLMEGNPEQAILNNVGGTKNVVELALEFNVEHFVNVSTDKAVNPTSIMGASKRISEYVVENASREAKPSQIFASVRFGNVLGSRGSVVPKFKQQIKNGEPITVTHPDMTRYFMTIPEASQLVLQAGGLEETGAVYVLDMGEPVKIMDLAKDLIKLSGLTPNVDIPIEITGVRPGEKLYEELLTDKETTSVTKYEKIHVAQQNGLPAAFTERLDELMDYAIEAEHDKVRRALSDLIDNNELSIPKASAVD